MTLDDAIVAFGQVASGDLDSLELDVRDYERLVKWLTELELARESAFSDIGLAARAVSENHQLKDENEKLRELVRISIVYCANGYCSAEDGCPMPTGLFGCLYTDKARELGVEVDADA